MKALKYILMACAGLVFASCVEDEKDLFSDSAAQRMNNAVEGYTNLLESSEEGWVMNFYPAHDGEMGGVVYTVRFKDGVVALRSQEEPDGDEQLSLYQVKGEQECLLTFDTYTELFHQYSEPINSSYPTGYESDYEFTFKGVSEDQDTVFLKGKRYEQPLQLIRLHSSAADYIKQIANMYSEISELPHPLAIVNETENIEVSLTDGVLSWAEYVDAPTDWDPNNQDYIVHYVPFITTLTGIHLQEPVTIGGETFQDCVYNADDRSITAVGANVYFPVVLPEGYVDFDEYVGNFIWNAYDGAIKLPITISANSDKTGYIIKGLSNYFDLVGTYNKATGHMEIHSQIVGESGGNNIWVCCWDLEGGGNLTWSTAAAVELAPDEEADVTTFVFKPTHDYDADFNTDSFILWSTTAAGASAGQFTSWTFLGTGNNRMYYMESIVKQE